jgi:hypothetical protein
MPFCINARPAGPGMAKGNRAAIFPIYFLLHFCNYWSIKNEPPRGKLEPKVRQNFGSMGIKPDFPTKNQLTQDKCLFRA